MAYETSSYLYEFIFEACEYFSNIEYICDPAEIYAVAGQINEAFDIQRLLKTMIVHNNEEYQIFDEAYKNFVTEYFREHNRQRQIREDFKDKKSKQNEQMKKLGNKQKELEKKIESIREKSESKKAEQLKEKQASIPHLDDCVCGTEYLDSFVKKVRKMERPNHNILMQEIRRSLMKACMYENSSEIMKAIKERGAMLKRISDENDQVKSELEAVRNKIADMQKQIIQTEAAFQRELNTIVKDKSVNHRAQFDSLTTRNAVKSTYAGDRLLDKDFSKMTETEKKKVADYIHDNARKFRTKLSKKIRTNNSNKIDMSDTIKKSCQTDGIPLRLIHNKPVRQKANLILILDVSGSCKNASELMLIFMHAMKEVFPGGCRTYAFTNRLYDISEFFEIDDATESAKKILNAIPRAGAYSNYEIPFRTFYEEHFHEITGDSYIYVIGDARNCKNNSGEEYVKAVARKAKKAYWLNTEEQRKWNTGDSIMQTYAQYMTKVAQACTPAELLGFLE